MKLVFYIFLLSFIYSQGIIGFVVKSYGESAEYRHHNKKSFVKVTKGIPLYDDDILRTKDDGFISLIYLDDKSQIKIQKNTEVRLSGTLHMNTIMKQVMIRNGIFNANIKKQKGSQFTVVTPTSVAAVKGTEFWAVVDGRVGDRFFGIDGLVEIQNTISMETLLMSKNKTVTSLNNGKIKLTDTKKGNVPKSKYDDIEGEIRIKFKDEDGNVKTMIIKYK